ncbi:uncharacterized protein LOC104894903 [Beta vulgaris subsp. vulgaris]|uniref:uncharacterized protein LOC104894903 n=1 Tax=Beta vulgaris subsp. vulgaris TaxID=3555 RepID=UPI00053F9C8D|nr:uncharacterized protein LOC104894903 [Beta vulgaris subsp. vulgaris]
MVRVSGDHGHNTDECVALRREVAYLLKQGHLKDLLTEKGKQTSSKYDDRRQPSSSPTHVKLNDTRETILVKTPSQKSFVTRARDAELEAMPVMFDDGDLGDDSDIHHDRLVISLTISNFLLKRVVMDNGSLTNFLMKDALEDMGIDERDIIRKSTVLVGFSGEAKRTMGELTLPTYAKGVNMPTKFYVIDCPSSYNVILGRPGSLA